MSSGLRPRTGPAEGRLLGGLNPQFAPTFGGGVRLGGQQPGVQVGSLAAATWQPGQRGTIGSFALAEQQVIRAALHRLAGTVMLLGGLAFAARSIMISMDAIDYEVRRALSLGS